MPDRPTHLPPMTLIAKLSLSNTSPPSDEQILREHHHNCVRDLGDEMEDDFRKLAADAGVER